MYSVRRSIRFSDADPAGVLFYANIFAICHDVYESAVRSLAPLVPDIFNHPSYALPIVHCTADYNKPLQPGDEVEIRLSFGKIGGTSFQIEYDVLNADGETAARATTIHVCIDRKLGKKVALPDSWKKAFGEI